MMDSKILEAKQKKAAELIKKEKLTAAEKIFIVKYAVRKPKQPKKNDQ